jgi:hypothetical protein
MCFAGWLCFADILIRRYPRPAVFHCFLPGVYITNIPKKESLWLQTAQIYRSRSDRFPRGWTWDERPFIPPALKPSHKRSAFIRNVMWIKDEPALRFSSLPFGGEYGR